MHFSRYKEGKVPDKFKADYIADPTVRFLEVHWFQPKPKDINDGKAYDKCTIMEATVKSTSGFRADHIDVVSETSVFYAFEDLINQIKHRAIPGKYYAGRIGARDLKKITSMLFGMRTCLIGTTPLVAGAWL